MRYIVYIIIPVAIWLVSSIVLCYNFGDELDFDDNFDLNDDSDD